MRPDQFRSNLKTQLDARAGLTNISAKVWRYPPGNMAKNEPTIFFKEVEDVTEGRHTYDNDVERVYTLSGEFYEDAAGAAEAKWATAEQNAYTLIDELSNQLSEDPTVNGACNHARVTTWNLAPTQNPDTDRIYMSGTFVIEIGVYP